VYVDATEALQWQADPQRVYVVPRKSMNFSAVGKRANEEQDCKFEYCVLNVLGRATLLGGRVTK